MRLRSTTDRFLLVSLLQFSVVGVWKMLAVRVFLLAMCSCPAVLGVIHNLDWQAAEDAVEPVALEISPQEDLGSLAARAFGARFS